MLLGYFHALYATTTTIKNDKRLSPPLVICKENSQNMYMGSIKAEKNEINQ